jgi:phosphoglycolate phosphatase
MSFKNKKYIIFDMDGTLIDSSKLLANTINYVRQNLGLHKMEDETILKAINDESVNAPMFFYESEFFEDFHTEFFNEYYQAHYKTDSRLYPGAKELLEKLNKTHKISLATNAYKKSAYTILFALGIEHYFDIIICGDEVQKPKPHPQMLDMIIEFYEDDKDRFLLVGDSTRDELCAKNAGIDSILVEWGFSEHKNSIHSFKELEELLY